MYFQRSLYARRLFHVCTDLWSCEADKRDVDFMGDTYNNIDVLSCDMVLRELAETQGRVVVSEAKCI